MESVKTVIPRSRSVSSNEDNDDVDEEEWTDTLAELTNGLSPGSNVKIENSSDIIIGTVTKFHGPVTIFQNVKLENEEISAITREKSKTDFNGNPIKSNVTDNNLPRKPKNSLLEVLKRRGFHFLTVISLLISITFGVIISKIAVYEKIENFVDVTPSNIDLKIYTKQLWRAEPTTGEMEPLKHPVDYVVIAHSAGSSCASFEDCSLIVRNIQQWHISRGNDIWYNFLIGGDGGIYVGRGWNVKPAGGNNAILMTFIGDFEKNELPPIMLSTLNKLLDVGVEIHKLKIDYKLVAHRQTKATLSPGSNACEAISRLPHFLNGAVKF
ncbi:hypothetical protein RI129_009046 [Pyrocoelia pectoralis]|uniref:Peptidoglycan recognition protein family domain-containing protein n=1 Tax=Pyrocoelia pectoralis TaxID=417401 RepID=A0AAN7VAZ9_9COLE